MVRTLGELNQAKTDLEDALQSVMGLLLDSDTQKIDMGSVDVKNFSEFGNIMERVAYDMSTLLEMANV